MESPKTASKLISMRFKDASLDNVLEFFARVTGYIIVKEAELNVRVTVISPHDVPVDEAFSVLNSILAIKGYTSIVNEKTVKIVPLTDAKQDAIPTQVGSDPAGIKPEDTIVTQVMPLAYADAAQLVKDLKDLVPKYGVMTAHARSNTLIITASSANIKRLAEIVSQLDISISNLVKVEVFSLQYADATTLAEVITKLFEKSTDAARAAEQERAQRGRFRGGFPGFGGGPGGGDNQNEGASDGATGENAMLQQLGEIKAVDDKNTNSLIVSASEQNLKIIRELIAQLDKKLYSEPETRVFSLKYADATEISNELNQAFSSTARNIFSTTGFGGGAGGFFGRQQLQQQLQQQQAQRGSEGTGVLGLPELVAVPDVRTNTVMVTTTAQQMEAIGRLVEQLDRDIADYVEDTRVFTLEHADASNVADVLNELLSTALFERQASTRINTGGFRGGGFGGGGFGGQFSSSGAFGTTAQTADTARGLTGNVKVVADETTNSLLITTYVRNFPAIENLITGLDILLPQVLIEAKIIEVTLDDESTFGVEWKWEKGKTTVGGKDYGQTGTTDYGLKNEVFGLKYGVLSDKLESLLDALTKNTKVNILSTPRIMTQNNQQAIINVGQEVPFLRSTQETSTGGVLTSYDFRDVGVILTVTPRINKSGTVSLDVNQQINSLVEFTLFNAPVIAKREASAFVTVKDNQTMVIGGLIKDDKTETVHKIPILGDIPLLGKLFRRKDTRTEKTELMVFITPHVAYTDDDANRITDEQKSQLNSSNRNNGSVQKRSEAQ